MKTTKLNTHWDRLDSRRCRQLQMAKLRQYLKRTVIPFSPYYTERFRDLNLTPESLRQPEDLAHIPFTTKSDFAKASPMDFTLQPDPEALRKRPSTFLRGLIHGRTATRHALEREFKPVLMTSTTGRSAEPVPFLYTHRDISNLEISGRRMMELTATDASYRHLNVFPFAPHLAFWQMHYAGLAFNTFCLSTGGGKTLGTHGNIAVIRKMKPDALIGMPTFVYHLLSVAVEKGIRWKNLQRIVLGGEKVPRGLRHKLRALCADLGAFETAVLSTYGFTEAKCAWSECIYPADREPSGFHLYPDLGIVEVVDPDTGSPVGEGEPGEIVYTPLAARGTVVLRYRTGDLIDGGLVHEPCPHCGRTLPRLLGRISRISNRKSIQFDKIKGTLVDFNTLEHVLDDDSRIGTWQLELRKVNDDPMEVDELIVHVSPVNKLEDADALKRAIRRQFLEVAEISPNDIVFHDSEAIRERQGVGRALKEERIVDNRPGSGDTLTSSTPTESKPENISP